MFAPIITNGVASDDFAKILVFRVVVIPAYSKLNLPEIISLSRVMSPPPEANPYI